MLHELHYFFCHLLGFFVLYKEEISLLAVARIRITALIDGVGTHHYSARLRLTEDASKTDYRYLFRVDNIAQHITCTNTWQLVDIAH